MAITKSINLLQNPIDIPDKNSEDYYIQALANLGQRIGIKGDGISYKSFSFLDSFTNVPSYSYNSYVGYLRYSYNSNKELLAEFGVAKNDLSEYKSLEITKNVNNVLYFDEDLSLSVIMNNIEKYSKNSIIINEDGVLTMMLIEKLIGTDDTDPNNSILQYYKFDIASNKLIYSAKMYFAYSDGRSNYYALIKTVNESENNILTNKYKMSIYLFNPSILDDFKTPFENLFRFSAYKETNNIPFTLLKPEYIDIDILESYNPTTTDITNTFDSNSPIGLILNNVENSYKYKSYTIDLDLNTSNNELLSTDPNKADQIYAICKDEYNLNNIDEELLLLNEDISQLYYVMFKYYNEQFYTEKRSKFFQRILCKIYEKSANKDYSKNNIMYFPLGYTIDYMCNSANEMQIYFSNNIYVTYDSLSNVQYLEEYWENNTNIVFDCDSISKIKVYAFTILYNSKYSDIINVVDIKDVYTMPYINANENWSINEADTKIKAKGDDAGNPNIIVLYSKDKNNTLDSYKVLTSIANNEVIENCEFEKRYFYLDNALFEGISNIDIKCYTYMPIVNEFNYSYFKNSIIINICELDCLENEGIMQNYLGSNILSLWNIVCTNDTLKYEPILADNEIYALPFGSTINILNETSGDYIAKINAQDILLLKSVINTLAQENQSLYQNNWLVIKNKIASEYSNITSNLTYLNNLNAIIQYNDNVIVNQNTVTTSQSKKYISNLSNIDITNALYPKYDISINSATMTGSQIVDQFDNDIVHRNISKITIDNEVITNIDEAYEEIQSIIKDKVIETYTYNVQIESENKLNINYSEYVFNSNIPSLDLKEIFVRNFDVLNRVNILSIDNGGTIYNGYIGSSFNEQSKSTLHIGSTENNINIGSDTLMKESDKMKFKKHDTLSLDFDNIIFNSQNSPSSNKPIVITKTINGVTFYSSSIYMLDGMMKSQIITGMTGSQNPIANWNVNDLSYFNKWNSTYYVCISNILKTIFNENTIEYDIIVNNIVSANNYDVIYIKNYQNEKLCFYKLNISPFEELLSENIANFGKTMNVTYYKTSNSTSSIKTIHAYVSIY